MVVENIESVTKNRSQIILDNGERIILYKGELRMLGIRIGKEMSQDTYSQIMDVVLPRRAKVRMLALLKQRDYTAYQISKKLLDAGYPSRVVDIALEYVKSYGYINDKRYVEQYIYEKQSSKSRKEIYQKLATKGIDRELLDASFKAAYEDYNEQEERRFDEKNLIIKTLRKRGFSGNESYEDKQKLLAYFYRRGFSVDDVYRAMEELKQIIESEE